MWWFAALHANLLLLYAPDGETAPPADAARCRLRHRRAARALSATLPKDAPDGDVIGLDADRFACARAAPRAGGRSAPARSTRCPSPTRAFGAIFSADVLCHDGVDERAALAQFHRCLVRTRHAGPEPAGLSLDDVAP